MFKKTFLFTGLIASVFLTGVYFGITIEKKKLHITPHKRELKTKFFFNQSNPEFINKNLLKKFSIEFEKCIADKLSPLEITELNNIQFYVEDKIATAAENQKFIEINWRNGDVAKWEKIVIKVKKCRRKTLKLLSKEEKLAFSKSMRNLNIKEIAKIFHGIQ